MYYPIKFQKKKKKKILYIIRDLKKNRNKPYKYKFNFECLKYKIIITFQIPQKV